MTVSKVSDPKWQHWFLGLAEYAATASKDPSTKVGAVIVDDRRIIRGMGYNGFPRGVHDTNERYNDRPTKYRRRESAHVNRILGLRALAPRST